MNTSWKLRIVIRMLVLMAAGSLLWNNCEMPLETSLLEEVKNRVDEYNEQAKTHPEIEVKSGSLVVPSGTGSSSGFSAVVGAESAPVTFTIENTGTGPLLLTGSPDKVTFSGPDWEYFKLNFSPSSPVAAGGSVDFGVVFKPTREGLHEATVSIENNDADENPYTFSVSGTGTIIPEPEIGVSEGGASVSSGGSRHFNEVLVQSSASLTFQVHNSGTANLLLTGSPKPVEISGPDQSMFSVDPQPQTVIAADGGSSSFTVMFMPTSPGSKSATLSIPNNDADESPFLIYLYGTGVSPEINIYKDNPENSIPSGTGSYSFSDVMVSDSGSPVVFTIENQGSSNLHLTGSPEKVTILGPDSTMFSVTTQPALSDLPTAGTTIFSVSFSPTSTGLKSATVSIANDDADENPYTFDLTGTGTEWHGVKWVGGGWDDCDAGAYCSMVVYGASVYIGSVWTNLSGIPMQTVRLSKSTDGGATWTNIVVDSASALSGFSHMSLGKSGSTLRIVYFDEGADDLVLATSTDYGDNWSKSTIDSTGNVGSYASIDPSGARISYYDASNGNLKYVKAISPAPVTVQDSANDDGLYSSIARYPLFTSSISISYYDATDGNLRLARSLDDGSSWSFQAVDTVGDVGQYSRICLESGIAISYYDATNKLLKFVRSADGGSTWNREIADDGSGGAADVGSYCSLSLSETDFYISYWDATNGDVKLVKGKDNGTDWNAPATLTTAGSKYSSVVADGDKVYVCYQVYDPMLRRTLLYLAKCLDSGQSFF